MKAIRLFLAVLLFPVITSVWAAPPFPPPGNLAEAVAALQAQVATLQTDLAAETAARLAAEARIAAIEAKSVLQLNGKLGLNTADPLRPTALFTEVNVQIVNGQGTTFAPVNGLGNLIVGYNEPLASPAPFRTGSHNIVVGRFHEYTSYGGFVAGQRNTISGTEASVSGGSSNTASGSVASVSGGQSNNALDDRSSVSGGVGNFASVSGGLSNIASGLRASVLGGFSQNATGNSQTIPALP